MNTDLIEMIGNLSRSLFSVQHLLYGLAYLLGFLFFFKAFQKFRAIAEQKMHASSHERPSVPFAYVLGGTSLLFLPSIAETLANTFFGASNILQYTHYNPYNVYSSMDVLIRTAGIIWFVRGCILLTQASEPGVQHGKKGLMFLVAGILSMNFKTTVMYLNWVMEKIAAYTASFEGQS